MAGQMAIFGSYHFIPESAQYQSKIMDKLLSRYQEGMDIDYINSVRSIYEEYLAVLLKKNLISKDDLITFSDLYPVFDPLYVTYDMGFESYESLKTVSDRIFSLSTHQSKMITQAERIVGRKMTALEKKFYSVTSLLIEESGGKIDSGLFVSKPGVLLLSETKWDKTFLQSNPNLLSEGQVTFLISGIAIESSLELIAHKEAKVARLTSSKTNAMNFPLYRVQGSQLEEQIQYLSQILLHRGTYEEQYNPRKGWGSEGGELFNITQPATKTAALCYSMLLKDFHNLFIGRMGPSGNELEVREIVRIMSSILHQRYPTVILHPDEYLKLSNDAKYKTSVKSSIEQRDYNMYCMPEAKNKGEEGLASIVGDTFLNNKAKSLLKTLNICTEQPDYLALSEFRARITYLTFPKDKETVKGAENYMNKLVNELHHMSVLAGSQVVIEVKGLKFEEETRSFIGVLQQKFGLVQCGNGNYLLVTTVKDLVQLLPIIAQNANIESVKSVLTAVQSLLSRSYPAVLSTKSQ
eukprot:TRINITY_DN7728_c0_g1_i1.p1 TRINITY_DN7728_c0_g1~~TRINITY_DN7728_c0_g1_i1.p1  ORF type:complete len:522 (-),score=99.87 TRINITY_DN7728_c0_g1_i1:53-1618(-)